MESRQNPAHRPAEPLPSPLPEAEGEHGEKTKGFNQRFAKLRIALKQHRQSAQPGF